MNKTQLITEGNRQIIVLPEEFNLTGKDIYLKKIGDNIGNCSPQVSSFIENEDLARSPTIENIE